MLGRSKPNNYALITIAILLLGGFVAFVYNLNSFRSGRCIRHFPDGTKKVVSDDLCNSSKQEVLALSQLAIVTKN